VPLVVAEREKFVPVFTAVTVTWGRTAPELSVTSPVMSPVTVWARTGRQVNKLITRKKTDADRRTWLRCMGTPSLAHVSNRSFNWGGSLIRAAANFQEKYAEGGNNRTSLQW